MLRHCRKEQPMWPWLNIVLLGVLWGLWGLRGREWVTVQVPTVMMQDPSDTGPVRGSRPQHWVHISVGTGHQPCSRQPS